MNKICGIDIKSAFVETTSLCNLSCKHCYNNSGIKHNNISFLDLEHIVFDLVALGAEHVSISGGEPLLHPEFDNIIGLLDKYPIKYQIITNGTLLDSKIELIEYYKNNLYVQISLDGVGSIHDELRGSGTFDSIEKNIKLLKEKNILYFFKTTIHKNNYTKLEDIVLKAIELGGTSISFSFINPVGRGLINTDLHMTQKEIFMTFNELKVLKEKYDKKIKVGIPSLYRNSICPWIAYNY